MDQIQVGHFIKECRKEKEMTQAKLAEIMGVSDRAVSKWETGKSMPDSSIMLELCEVLGITVNELLTGRRIDMGDYESKVNELTADLYKNTEKAEKITKIVLHADLLINLLGVMVGSILIVKSLLHQNYSFIINTISAELLLAAILCVSSLVFTIFEIIYFVKLKNGKQPHISYFEVMLSVYTKVFIFIFLILMCFVMGVPQVMKLLSP